MIKCFDKSAFNASWGEVMEGEVKNVWDCFMAMVQSPLTVAVITAVVTGWWTKRVALNGKKLDWSLSEKSRKEERLYQRRVELYEKLLPLLMKLAAAKIYKETFPEKMTPGDSQVYLEILMEFNSVLPIAQLYASQKSYEAMERMSYLINIDTNPLAQIAKIPQIMTQAGELQTVIREELMSMNVEGVARSK